MNMYVMFLLRQRRLNKLIIIIAVLVWSCSTSGGEFAGQLDLSSVDRMFSWKSTLTFTVRRLYILSFYFGTHPSHGLGLR